MRKEQNFRWNRISLGTCYYPEHWDKSMWRSDLQRMKAHGIFTVRIAEFAWNLVEPADGVFQYGFWDEFLNLAEEEQISVIFGTPTATPPAWLSERYPEILNCTKDGIKYRHGMRRHYNYNSPVYQQYSRRIVEKLAEHYGKHPAIVGWQIDNELNCETAEFYSESDSAAFREFLREEYGTLEVLNQAWGTVFWNQTYNDWEEIYVPRPTINNSDNPHLKLDYKRFISESAIRFCRMQCDIIRQYRKPGDFITTNGMFGNLDNHRMADECLDVYTYDSYPNFAYGLDADKNADDLKDRKWSRNLADVRAVCPHFGIMEQQSGANGWNTRMAAPAPKPGQVMLWTMQSIAHGADYVSYFRWRTARMGTEMYWHGILDYDNKDNRKLKEIGRIRERVEHISGIAGAEYVSEVGMLKDYDNIWDSELDTWHGFISSASEKSIFRKTQLTHTPLDMVYVSGTTEVCELQKYKVLIYPHPLIITSQTTNVLAEYVRGGGVLIIGARAGQKDMRGQCVDMPMPGLFSELTGTEVCDFTLVGPSDEAVAIDWNGQRFDSGVFNDILTVNTEDSKVLAVYDGGYYAGAPALVERTIGNGKILHFGGTFTDETVQALLEYTGTCNPWSSMITLPEECEIAVREKDGERDIFVLNYSRESQQIILHSAVTDLDTGETVSGFVTFAPYETKVYRVQ